MTEFSAAVDQRVACRRVAQTISDIQACHALEEDWDGEGSLPATPDAVGLARRVVDLLSQRLGQGSMTWHTPSVAAVGDGGLTLFWELPGRRALLRVGPDCEHGIVCVTDVVGAPSTRDLLSVGDAVAAVADILQAP